MMRDRLSWAMDELDMKHSERRQWLSHLHFAKLPLSGLSDVGANFIPYLVSAGLYLDDAFVWQKALYLSSSLVNTRMCLSNIGAVCILYLMGLTSISTSWHDRRPLVAKCMSTLGLRSSAQTRCRRVPHMHADGEVARLKEGHSRRVFRHGIHTLQSF